MVNCFYLFKSPVKLLKGEKIKQEKTTPHSHFSVTFNQQEYGKG